MKLLFKDIKKHIWQGYEAELEEPESMYDGTTFRGFDHTD